MKDAQDELTIIRVPDQLVAAVGSLRAATGREDFDIVTSALRTYLADERQRAAVVAHFYVTPAGYPAAYVVTMQARLVDGAVFDPEGQKRAEKTFGQINRFGPSRLEWSTDGTSVGVQMTVSGQTPEQAGSTATKMVLNRLVDELGLASPDGLAVEITETYDQLYG